MKFSIKQKVVICKTNKIVEIIDYECVEGIELYYTSDNSAYPESQLKCLNLNKLVSENELLKLTILKIISKIVENEQNCIDNKKLKEEIFKIQVS